MGAQIKEDVRDSLIQKHQSQRKLGTVCGTIMIGATIVGLCLLFAPVLTSPNSRPREPSPCGFGSPGPLAEWPAASLSSSGRHLGKKVTSMVTDVQSRMA